MLISTLYIYCPCSFGFPKVANNRIFVIAAFVQWFNGDIKAEHVAENAFQRHINVCLIQVYDFWHRKLLADGMLSFQDLVAHLGHVVRNP